MGFYNTLYILPDDKVPTKVISNFRDLTDNFESACLNIPKQERLDTFAIITRILEIGFYRPDQYAFVAHGEEFDSFSWSFGYPFLINGQYTSVSRIKEIEWKQLKEALQPNMIQYLLTYGGFVECLRPYKGVERENYIIEVLKYCFPDDIVIFGHLHD